MAKITVEDVGCVNVKYRFKDSLDDEVLLGTIVIFQTLEQCEAFDEGISKNDPDWISFDEQVFFFIHAYLGETLEEFYEPENSSDFVLVRKGKEEDE